MKRGIGTVSKKEIVVSDVEKEHDNPIAELVHKTRHNQAAPRGG